MSFWALGGPERRGPNMTTLEWTLELVQVQTRVHTVFLFVIVH